MGDDTRSTFDWHVHFGDDFLDTPLAPNLADGLKRDLDTVASRPRMARSFVITPTYNLAPSSEDWKRNQRINQVTSKLLNNYFGKLSAYCGVSIHRSYAVDFAEQCIELPNFIGIKLRNFSIAKEDYQDSGSIEMGLHEIPRRFEQLVALTAKHGAILLSHFAGDRDGMRTRPELVRRLLAVMQRYPRSTLIIAHGGSGSFIGTEGLKQIGQYFKSRRGQRRNIYMEISYAISMADEGKPYKWSNYRHHVEAWREFDMNYVLYGSDATIDDLMASQIGEDEVPFSACPITAEERRNMCVTNGVRLLQEVAVLRGTAPSPR